MFKFDDICKLIEDMKTPCIRVQDLHGNPLFSIDDGNNVATTVTQLRQYEAMLSMYGKIQIKAGTEAQARGNYKGAYSWICGFEKPGAINQQVPGFPNWDPTKMYQMMGAAPPGFVNAGIMDAKLEAIRAEMKYQEEIRKLQEANKDPFEKYIQYIPVLMGAVMDDSKMERMMKYWALTQAGRGTGANAMGFVPPVNTLTFKDVDSMSSEDKNKKIETLLESVLNKVNWEEFIQLLRKLNEKPVLAETVQHYIPALLNLPAEPVNKQTGTEAQLTEIQNLMDSLAEGKVSAQHMILILDGVDKRPEMIKKALPFLATL